MKVLLIFIIILISLRCETTEPPNKANLTLNVEDVSCTEVWLKLTTTNLPLPTAVVLKQNDAARATINLTTADSLLYLDSLLPKQTYIFQISSIQHPVSSNQAIATALDTTSHNFTWQTFTFGEHSSSVLYDVAIINENNIWAVGEIYMNDSTGQSDTQPFAIAQWDGFTWKLGKVSYHDYNQTIKYPGPIFSVYEIDNVTYVASYANLLKWTGLDWEEKAFFINQLPFNGQVLKILGDNAKNIYCTGRNGYIYNYYYSGWKIIPNDNDLDVYDLCGKQNGLNSYEIICVAAKQSVSSNKKIFQINNNTLKDLSAVGIPSSIRSIWFKPRRKYYVVGSGMFTKNDIFSNESWNSIGESVTQFYTNSIDGNNLNDIVVCGAFGELLHFNGATWKSFQNELELQSGSYRTIKIKNNLLVAVGYDSPKAIISIGRR